jgi:hypothetical protein
VAEPGRPRQPPNSAERFVVPPPPLLGPPGHAAWEETEAAAYGLTPDDLTSWAPFTPVEIHWARKHALTPAVARRWALEGLHVCDAVRAVALRLTPEETRRWAAAHFAPSDAVEAAEMGIPLSVAVAWREAGFILPDAALLIHDGWTLSAATAARYAGIASGPPEGP